MHRTGLRSNTLKGIIPAALTILVLALAPAACGPQLSDPLEDDLDVESQGQAITYHILMCYQGGDDHDGDGYAADTVPSSYRVPVPSTNEMLCPAGWVKEGGDCDDNNPLIHPRGPEAYGTATDANCSGDRVESTFTYYPAGYGNTSSSFWMRVNIHDPILITVYTSGYYELQYVVEYQDLAYTGNQHKTGYRKATSVSTSGRYVNIKLSNLSAGSVYRARVRFYRAYHGAYGTSRVGVGAWTDWYYTATLDASSFSTKRSRIVNRALYERYLGESLGLTGYRGAPWLNGTRYGAVTSHLWCSEFYSWVTNHETKIGFQPTVASLVGYFIQHNSYYFNWLYFFAQSADRGDYLALSGGTHSAMVLDYDASTGTIWTVEGNVGNKTAVMRRSIYQVAGLGRLTSSM